MVSVYTSIVLSKSFTLHEMYSFEPSALDRVLSVQSTQKNRIGMNMHSYVRLFDTRNCRLARV